MLLVDDSEVFGRAALNFLADNARFEICGLARSVSEALTLINTSMPELVIMDINMPKQCGLEGTRLLKALPVPPKVVLISLTGSAETVTAALATGADGFVAKSSIGTTLIPLIMSLFTDQMATHGDSPNDQICPYPAG